MDRKLFVWDVDLADERGGIIKTKFSSYWSPKKDYVTPGLIASTCAAQESVARKIKLLPIGATLIEAA